MTFAPTFAIILDDMHTACVFIVLLQHKEAPIARTVSAWISQSAFHRKPAQFSQKSLQKYTTATCIASQRQGTFSNTIHSFVPILTFHILSGIRVSLSYHAYIPVTSMAYICIAVHSPFSLSARPQANMTQPAPRHRRRVSCPSNPCHLLTERGREIGAIPKSGNVKKFF